MAGAALQASREYQEALLGGAATHGGGDGPLPTFQRWGAFGVLNVAIARSQVDCALGGLESGRKLLSGDVWAWLEAFFRTPEIGWQV